MKYIAFLLLLFANIFAFSQEKTESYIDPVTFKLPTAKLAAGADLMRLEKILGSSKFAVPQRIWNAIYSPDGKFIVVSGYSYVACFDQQTGKRVWQRFLEFKLNSTTSYPVRAIAIHKKTNRLLVGTDNGKVWQLDFKTGKTQRILGENMGWLMAVTFSPNGRFAAAIDIRGKYKMWDLKTGKTMVLPTIKYFRGEAISFSNDGQLLAVGFDKALHVINWDNQTTKKYNVPSTVQSIAFINNDKEILIAGWTGYIQRIHLESKEVLWEDTTTDWLINLRVLPNKTSALAISPFHVLHIDWEINKITTTNMTVRTAMDLHPDGKTILTIGQYANRVEQLDWQTEEPINNRKFYTDPPTKLAFSPDGNYLAAAPGYTADKGIFWNTKKWTIVGEIEGNKLHRFNRFVFSADSQFFHATIKQNNVRIPKGQTPDCFSVPSFTPIDRSKVSTGTTHPYRSVSTNLESVATVHLKKLLPIRTAGFSGNLDDSLNRHLFGGWTIEEAYFAGITNENMLYIFDNKTGEKVAGTPLPDFKVMACAIHPEAKVVAVTAWDGLIYIYRW